MSRYARPELPLVAMGAHSAAEEAKSKRQAGLKGATEMVPIKRKGGKSHRKASRKAYRKASRKACRKASRKASHRKTSRKACRKSCRCGH